jgi:hypothetical protein
MLILVSRSNMGKGSTVSNKVEEMFKRLSGVDGEIDSEELQDMLTAHFSKGIISI